MHTAQVLKGPQESAGTIISDLTRLRKAQQNLEALSVKVEESHTAMTFILSRVEAERKEWKGRVASHIKELVMPYLEKAKVKATGTSMVPLLDVLEKNLLECISPFCSKLSAHYSRLSPMELKVADLVRHGRTSKEIAALLSISPKTVGIHRGSIREKMGLKLSRKSLRGYLLSLEEV